MRFGKIRENRFLETLINVGLALVQNVRSILVIFDKCSFVSIAKVLRNCFGCKKKRLCQGPFSFLRIYVIRRRRGGKKCPLFDGRSFCIVMGSSMIRLHADWPRWRTLSSLLLPSRCPMQGFRFNEARWENI